MVTNPIITERIWNKGAYTLDVSQIVGFWKNSKDCYNVIFKNSKWNDENQAQYFEPAVMLTEDEKHSCASLWIDYFTEYNGETPYSPGLSDLRERAVLWKGARNEILRSI